MGKTYNIWSEPSSVATDHIPSRRVRMIAEGMRSKNPDVELWVSGDHWPHGVRLPIEPLNTLEQRIGLKDLEYDE